MYSDSQVDSATVGYFFDFHEIGELFCLNKNKILLYCVNHSDQTPNLRRCKLRSLTLHFSGNAVRNGMYLLNTLGYVLLLPNAVDMALIETVIIYEQHNSNLVQYMSLGRLGGARGVMVIVVGNGHGDSSSNPGRE